MISWVLRRENGLAELDDAAVMDDEWEEVEAGRRTGVVNSIPLRICNLC